jgi:RNA polymerase sigma-70 factor, ECF subfamily
MEQVRTGDVRAFEVVFDRHAGAAFSLAYRMCGYQAGAEDVVQEAFLSLWRSGASYDRTRGSVRSWILSVVHHRAIDVLRRETTRDARDLHTERGAGFEELARSPHRTDTEVERRDDAHRVRSALSELPRDQRRVIELAFFGGFTHTEIAEMLEVPAGTVKGRMRLGLSKLRLSLSGGGFVP